MTTKMMKFLKQHPGGIKSQTTNLNRNDDVSKINTKTIKPIKQQSSYQQ